MMHGIYRAIGEIKRKLNQILERLDIMTVNEQEVKDAITELQNDLATKLGEVAQEVQTIENQISAGQPADLTALRDLVNQTDTTVKNFALPTVATTSTEPGGTTSQPGGAATPGV